MIRRQYRRLRYLTRLIASETHKPGRGKRFNWPHFCHRCGADISRLERGKRYCEKCECQN
jgi:hypothetical protein